MSGNYDYPPASSRRPSRPRGPESPLTESLPQRVQRMIDALSEPHDEPGQDSEQNSPRRVFRTSLHQILDDIAPDIIAQSIHEGLEIPREGHSTARPSRDRLLYLRNLINSESNHSNPTDTDRALEALNQEIEEHRLEQARELAHTRSTVQQQLQQLGSEVTSSSRRHPLGRGILDRSRTERPQSTLSPASLAPEPRSANRLIRRRSFRPDFRGIDPDSINPSIPTPSLMPQPAQSIRDGRDGRGRLKRRKLDTDDNREGMRGFNYGQYGQVVPGALRMEIASCDGGVYDPDGDSLPGHILRDDPSVYCTKADRCNLVLRHQGEAPFCLKKLVIKSPPRNGYDSPIQEGMVFVSMTSDELLTRTAQHQIQYSSDRRRQNRRRTRALPSQEYLNSHRAPLQSLERTVLTGSTDTSTLTNNEPTNSNFSSDPQNEFRVTTDYNENSEESVFLGQEDDYDDESPTIAELERIQEEDPLCTDSEESGSEDDDEDEDESGLNIINQRRREIQRRLSSMRGWPRTESRRQGQPSLVDPIPPPPTGSAPSGASGSEVMKPHARFFIEREKSMVSIKFDPPPSGRFILIKLWSPRNAGNIDIQSIIAHGYAGPRFFPSGGFR